MPPAAVLSRQELFARLAEGHAAGVTVVTPNRRLARALRADFDLFQLDRKKTVWEDADILPLDAFVARGYEDALYADGGEKLPLLLSEAQARELWEEAIRGSAWGAPNALLDAPRTAARAMDAWRLAHAWGLAGMLEKGDAFGATEDTRAFAEWARAYARRCKRDGFVDAARLPDLKLPAPKTKVLVAYAFDIVPPQAQELFSRFDFSSCAPERKESNSIKTSFSTPKEELEAAARWARARLEAGAKSIGVVVPALEQRRREAARVFAAALGTEAAFNVSLGEPLSGRPIVAFALGLLEFAVAEKPYEEASRLLRSPFLGGAEAERSARALLDARLRREAPATISLPKLVGMVEGCPVLRSHLERIFDLKPEKNSPQDWAEHFTAVLAAAGFPGPRALDSAEYQARERFNAALRELACLGSVVKRLTAGGALARLRDLCAERFQPESGEAPVQVLGLLESVGQTFDALWVSGLTDEAWPLRSRPNPFLPLALQRKAGIPEASAEASLALDRRITAGWAAAAEAVVFSSPRREDDRDLSPSPLISRLPEEAPAIPVFSSHRDLIFAVRELDGRDDEKAVPVSARAVKGGTRVLVDQAACPFRAYARWRLGAEALESPEPGPDAMDRGILLHGFMAELFRLLPGSSFIQGEAKDPIRKAAKHAVAGAGLEGRFAELEVARLVRLANDWLEVERKRAPFEVVHTEQKRELEIGGLALSGRIDRMDRLADGSHAILDYKTGSRVTSNDWLGPRPDDPQLPLYAVTAPEPVGALAFAKLRAGDMKFLGFSLKDDQLPGAKAAKSWPGLLQGWKAELESLAGGFAAGEAAVDPKRGLKTCERCDLQPLCRVHEKLGALEEEEGAE